MIFIWVLVTLNYPNNKLLTQIMPITSSFLLFRTYQAPQLQWLLRTALSHNHPAAMVPTLELPLLRIHTPGKAFQSLLAVALSTIYGRLCHGHLNLENEQGQLHFQLQ